MRKRHGPGTGDVLDNSGSERAARVAAFLNVELFRVMYDQYKGNSLPPPLAIERHRWNSWASLPNKRSARQTFMKSATYAGFIDQSPGRFVKPGIAHKDEGTRPADKPAESERGRGSGDEPPGGLHPFIQGLLRELPPAGSAWPEAKRKLWLGTAESIFNMIYKNESSKPDFLK